LLRNNLSGGKLNVQVVSSTNSVSNFLTNTVFNGMVNTHLALTIHSNDQITLYIDGIRSVNTVFAASIPASTNQFLGQDVQLGSVSFVGSFDEFRIWSSVLGVYEIVSHKLLGPNGESLSPSRQYVLTTFVLYVPV
jgi:Concanavalin A-like lectin/glucanases superfamily